MKIQINFKILLLFLITLQYSCTKESNTPHVEAPDMDLQSSIQDNPYLGQIGETIQFVISAQIPGKFNGFSIVERKKNKDTVVFETTRKLDASLENKTSFSYTFDYALHGSGDQITLQFILTDQEGNDVTNEWNLEVQ